MPPNPLGRDCGIGLPHQDDLPESILPLPDQQWSGRPLISGRRPGLTTLIFPSHFSRAGGRPGQERNIDVVIWYSSGRCNKFQFRRTSHAGFPWQQSPFGGYPDSFHRVSFR